MISPDPDDVTPVRLAEIKEAFNAALDQPAETRDVFLRERYPANIAAEVRALLAAYARADSFLERPALLDTAAAGALEDVLPVAGAELLPIGTHLGPYVITAHLGEGGMGHVFRARRDDQSFDQQVAIKVVRADIATSTMVERLRQERRILAALDHPNIARLVDGGSTDAGLPYAVMELVEGVPIDQYAESHALDLPSRRQLFRTVCGAVQYAHERLVVHRDLKPSNILVTANGTPKLLDFGISKILTPDQTDIARTRTGWWALTPRYASPEQIRGEAVSVASDVYALGVLAYELFTRVSPYGAVTTESRTALEHAILESDPPPPSRVAPPALQRALRGDLDRIVMKALEKPLARRYANVEQLCDDLDNYARGRPVSVGPDAWTYRARKFVQRHRLGVTAAVTALAALTAGGATTFYQAQVARHERAIAEERFEQVRGLANAFLFEFPNAIKDRTGTTEARKEAVTRALAYLDGPAGENTDNPRLLAETARAYLELGDVLGNPYVANLGDQDRAEASYQKALTRVERLTARPDVTPDDWVLLLQANLALGDMRWSKSDNAHASERYQRAFDLSNDPRAGPDRPALRQLRGRSLYLLGQTEMKSGKIPASLPFFQRASIEAKACLTMPPDTTGCERLLNTIEAKLGDVYRLQGDPAQALVHSREASRLSHAQADRTPDRRDLRRLMVMVDIRYASDLASTSSQADANALFARTCDTAQTLATADPSDAQAAADVASCLATWARVALDADDLATSERSFDRSIAVLTPMVRETSHYEYRLELARAYEGLATIAVHRTDWTRAIADGDRARALLEPMIATTPAVGPFLVDVYEQMLKGLEARARRSDRTSAERAADWTSVLDYADRDERLLKTLDAAHLLDAEDAGWQQRIAERVNGAQAALARVKTTGR